MIKEDCPMKFLTVISKGRYDYDYDSYFKSLMEIKDQLDCDFLDKYIKCGYFHDYYVKNIELSAYEKGKSCFFLKLSENYRDSAEQITLKYTNVESIEYSNERGYQDDYLYGEITYDGKHLKHEILLGDGKLNIIFDSVSISN